MTWSYGFDDQKDGSELNLKSTQEHENDGPMDHPTSIHHVDFCSISMLVGHKIILHPGWGGASQNYTPTIPDHLFFSASKRSQRFTPALLGDICQRKWPSPKSWPMSTLKRDHFKMKGLRVCLPSRVSNCWSSKPSFFRGKLSVFEGSNMWLSRREYLEGLSDWDIKRTEDEIEVEDILPTQYVIPKSLKV